MNEAMRDAGLKLPVFEVDTFFTITFYRSPEYSLKKQISGGVSGGVILEYIQKYPGSRVTHMQQTLRVPQRTIERVINRLKTENKIIFKGSPKTGGYYIK